MKTEKSNNLKNIGLVVGGLALTSLSANATELFTVNALGSAGSIRSELIASDLVRNATESSAFPFEAKCGEKGKTKEAKCGEKGKAKEAKCGEGKCGEEGKAKEAKCGEGKCGEEGKSKEAKCGEGKCGEK